MSVVKDVKIVGDLEIVLDFNVSPKDLKLQIAPAFLALLLKGNDLQIESIHTVAYQIAEKFGLEEAKEKLKDSPFHELWFWTDFYDLVREFRDCALEYSPWHASTPLSELITFWVDTLGISDINWMSVNPPAEMCYYLSEFFSVLWEDYFYKVIEEEKIELDEQDVKLVDSETASLLRECYWKTDGGPKFSTRHSFIFRTLIWHDFRVPQVNPVEVWDKILDELMEYGALVSVEDCFWPAIEEMAAEGKMDYLWLIPKSFLIENYDKIEKLVLENADSEETVVEFAERLGFDEKLTEELLSLFRLTVF